MSKKQKIKYLFVSLFLVTFFSFLIPNSIYAQKEKFAININPVRGSDFWKSQESLNFFINFQKNLSTKNDFPVTWLIRPDYYLNSTENIFLKSEYKNDDLGIFLEVTPSWTKLGDIDYRSNLPWYHAQNIFLSGYNPKDRLILIDIAMSKFKDTYGVYPKSVGAWHVDSTSAKYLVEKYGVNNFLICSDQTSTDGYQIWGGWWGIPYFPSKNNLLLPAKSEQDKLDATVIFWALRDPINGYGGGINSLYSLQSNDYSKLKLNTDYFNSLTNIYSNQTSNDFGQITVGLENDDLTHQVEYKNQIENLTKKDIKFITSSQFYSWYSSKYPKLSPDTELFGIDPLNPKREFKWILSKNGRIGMFKEATGNWIVNDFRNYTNNIDPYKDYRNVENVLNWKIPAEIDSVLNVGQTTVYSDQIKFKSNNRNLNFFIIISAIIILSIIMFIIKKIKFIPSIIIIIGTIILSLIMIRSGIQRDFGIGFWGPNGHDGIWHLSLINQLQQNIPPKNPVFSNTILNNYHWGFDLFAAFIGKILNNNVFAYFQFLPILFGLLIGFLSFKVIKINTKNHTTAVLFTLLTYFTGSFGWIYTLIKSGQLGGESLFWSMQSISTLINPPYALSLIIILIGLLIWSKNNSTSKYFLAIANGLLFGLLSGIKVYAGILIGLTLVVLWFIDFLKHKKIVNYNFVTWITTLVVSIIILLFLGVLHGSSFLEFKPFWFVHSMIESVDKFYLPQIASYRMSLSQNLTFIKFPFFVAIEIALMFIFLIGNMGFRTLGFLNIYQKIKKHQLTSFENLVLILMFISFLIPMLFVQKGTAWNTIQFFYYFLFFSNVFFAQFISNLIKPKNTKTNIIVLIIFILSNLTTYTTIKDYLGNPPPSAIPSNEVEALDYLKKQKDGIVLTFPYDRYSKDKLNLDTPIPMYLYETTAYVSAFTNKTVFLEDEMNLDITGFDWQSRRLESEKFFNSNDEYFARGFLVNNQIDYIYLVNNQTLSLSFSQLQINQIFDNGQIRIYQVQR